MGKRNFVKFTHCPRCRTENILTLGHDQMCMECDWDNFKVLVDLGQLDNLKQALREQFPSRTLSPNIQEAALDVLEDSLTA